jgi:hypothetical protein
MMYPPASGEVTCHDYPVKYPPSASSTERMDGSEMLDSLIFSWLRQMPPENIFHHQNLSPLLEIDPSSVQPSLGLKSETSSIEETYEEAIPEEILEYDVMVRIPPKKKYTIDLHIKDIRKAVLRIVEPD